MLTNIEKTILHLSLIKGIGPASINRIVQYFLKNLNDLYCLKKSDFLEAGINQDKAKLCIEGLQDKNLLDLEIAKAEKNNISILTILSEKYPKRLKEIQTPPPILYYKGNLNFCENNLAVVGTRKCNSYARAAMYKVLPETIQQGWNIISGGALGVDTKAHELAMNTGQTTVVLGSGLLSMYPKNNIAMFEKIVESGGSLISSFALSSPPEKINFPIRNRIVAGLSSGILVVQAPKKSGALITAEYGLEQGREIFAIPGPIDMPECEGSNTLLQKGAHLVANSEDITSNLFAYPTKQIGAQENQIQKNEPKSTTKQKTVLDALYKPKNTSELLESLNLEEHELSEILFDLEIENKVCQNFVGMWEKA